MFKIILVECQCLLASIAVGQAILASGALFIPVSGLFLVEETKNICCSPPIAIRRQLGSIAMIMSLDDHLDDFINSREHAFKLEHFLGFFHG